MNNLGSMVAESFGQRLERTLKPVRRYLGGAAADDARSVRIRADHRNPSNRARFEGQGAVVAQEHRRLGRCSANEREALGSGRTRFNGRDRCVQAADFIEHPKQPLDRRVQIELVDETTFDRVNNSGPEGSPGSGHLEIQSRLQ